MDSGASLATQASLLSSPASSSVSRRYCSSQALILSNRTLHSFAFRKIAPPISFCRISTSSIIKNSRTEMRESYQEVFHDSREFGILSLSPLVGRYASKVKNLRPLFSEYGLLKFRILVEVKWLLKLSEIPEVEEVAAFSEDARSFLEAIVDNFSIKDALEVKKIEEKTNHDVKAVEYFLKQKCGSCPEVAKVQEFFHFACTSEDINNLAYALSLKEALNNVIFPEMVELCKAIANLAKENAHIPMLSRTHGQPASSTTLGKEMSVFAFRLCNKGEIFSTLSILGKFAGASGNYNAHKVAYPMLIGQA